MKNQNDLLSNDPGSLFIAQLASMYIENELVNEAIGMCIQTLKSYPGYDECRLVLMKAYQIQNDVESFSINYNYLKDNVPSIIPSEFKEYYNQKPKEVDTQTDEINEIPAKLEDAQTKTMLEDKLEESINILDNLQNTIRDSMKSLNSIIGIVVSDDTGIPITSSFKMDMDIDETTALISLTINDMREALNIIELSSFKKIYIEIGKGILYIFPLTTDTYLTIIGTKNTNLGMVHLIAKKLISEIKVYL
jgi:predicted regulator of Ras-like GTPase activity (Roadblock/LC7/MglB family)